MWQKKWGRKIDEEEAIIELQKLNLFNLFLFFLVGVILTLLGLIMIYHFASTTCHAVIDGYLYIGGNYKTGSFGSKADSGFKFWFFLLLNILMSIFGFIVLLCGYIGLRAFITVTKTRLLRLFGKK